MKKFSLILILILSLSAYSQNEVGTIRGEVTDPNGALIPNANVKAIPIIDNKPIEEKSLSTITNDVGQFNFYNIPVGLYEIQIRTNWMEVIVKKQVTVTSNQTVQTELGFTKYFIEACSDVLGTVDLTTERDKAEIIREMLKEVKIGEINKPFLSTKNIKTKWIGEDKKQFNLMSQSDIQHQADIKGDFEYYNFSTFKIKGTCVEVSLDYIWAVGKNSKTIYMSGEGQTYEFRKMDGKWIKRFVIGWVS